MFSVKLKLSKIYVNIWVVKYTQSHYFKQTYFVTLESLGSHNNLIISCGNKLQISSAKLSLATSELVFLFYLSFSNMSFEYIEFFYLKLNISLKQDYIEKGYSKNLVKHWKIGGISINFLLEY